jgi:hypothetical protein
MRRDTSWGRRANLISPRGGPKASQASSCSRSLLPASIQVFATLKFFHLALKVFLRLVVNLRIYSQFRRGIRLAAEFFLALTVRH